ncbi:hypothetical protein HDV02_005143 [Globomyces sp. JEL0801]|nr:hypothetical protein HDV02_005143 [Globomyces sp. JEL0801]
MAFTAKKLPFWLTTDKLERITSNELDSCATAVDRSELPTESVTDSNMLGSKNAIIDQLLDGRKVLIDKSSQSKQPKNYLCFRNDGFFGKLKSGGVDQNTLKRESNISGLDYTDFNMKTLDLISLNDETSTVNSSAESIVFQTIAPEPSCIDLQPAIDTNPQPILKKHESNTKLPQSVKFNDTVHLFPLFKPNDFVIPNPHRSSQQSNCKTFT